MLGSNFANAKLDFGLILKTESLYGSSNEKK